MVDADLIAVVRFVHVTLAAFWVGGDVFFFLLIGPVLKAMGPAGETFATTLFRRGGFGKYLFPVSTTTILAGAFLYVSQGYHLGPFATASNAVLTIGATIALIVFFAGLIYFLPRERALVRITRAIGPEGATPQQTAELQRLGVAMEKPSKVAVTGLALAFLLMVGRTIFY